MIMEINKNGKNAITNYKSIKNIKNITIAKVILKTGRTHQIRVHMNYEKNSIIEEGVYIEKNQKIDKTKRQALHSKTIMIKDTINNKIIKINSLLPKYILKIIKQN